MLFVISAMDKQGALDLAAVRAWQKNDPYAKAGFCGADL
jgi:uncharacterized protein YciI